jgi:hypothetical protein
VGSIVLGLALQETLGNLMAGIALLFERPFSIGDWIRVGPHAGEVIQINWRSVHLRTLDRNLLVLPNSVLGRETITNVSAPERLQIVRLDFGFALEDPPNRVKEMLRETALKTPHVAADPAPRAHAIELLDDRIRYQAVLGLDEPKAYRKLIDIYTTRVWYAAQRAGLRLPLPTTLEYQVHRRHGAEPDLGPVVTRLADVIAFRHMARSDLERLARDARRLWFAAGEAVLQEGEASDAVYVIDSGRASMVHKGDGQEATEVLELAPGELFGEIALSRGQPSPVSVVAITDLQVLSIPVSSLEPLLETQPKVAHRLASLMDLRAEAIRRVAGEE